MGISYKQIESNSVGYKTDYEMRSLDFEDFLWARGYDEAVIESMFTHLCDATPFSEVEMNVFSTAFMDYCVLGGMPAVVASHIRTGTFEGTLQLQRQLILDYQEDIRKYAQGLDQATNSQRVSTYSRATRQGKQEVPNQQGCQRSAFQRLSRMRGMA